ncbi:hypothetical protein GC175_04305 [bacterium]|nr:hypothetical protein [bacterium]
MDPSIFERNRASTARLRSLTERLTDVEMQHPVGEHWTVAIALAHLAFWDRRASYVLSMTQREGKVSAPDMDMQMANDLSLPLWAAIPPREAARLAIESADSLDTQLESYPQALLAQVHAHTQRWVERDWHRNSHLDEVEAALTER